MFALGFAALSGVIKNKQNKQTNKQKTKTNKNKNNKKTLRNLGRTTLNFNLS